MWGCVSRKLIEELTKRFVDSGSVMEAGWQGLMIACKLQDAPIIQKSEMRKAFYAGAQHIFGVLNSILDPGIEPTEKDLEKVTKIHNELQQFIKEFKEEQFT